MTYGDYNAECQRRQRDYIASEQARMVEVESAWRVYQATMLKLGFHPLDRREITARNDQLLEMGHKVEVTHGDSVAMRCAYEMRQESAA